MIGAAHLGELSSQRPSLLPDVNVSGNLVPFSMLLGNTRSQGPTTATTKIDVDEHLWLWMLDKQFNADRPDSKLTILKRQRFTPEGRERRIAASLAALAAPQPTALTREQWKEVVEEIEDEDED